MNPESTTSEEYPNLSDRVQSTFIDTIFIILVMFGFASILDRYENTPTWIKITLFFVLWVVYEPLCTTLGFTLGNLIKGIRVRQHSNTVKRINIFQALLRYILKVALGWLSFLTIHSNPQRRAIHDLAAGSVMIKK
ncbi:MAG TPA: RDD family protein [Chitinophagaceae bacterium]|nr:RDD family protein [Chitinophagaceae bacterium]